MASFFSAAARLLLHRTSMDGTIPGHKVKAQAQAQAQAQGQAEAQIQTQTLTTGQPPNPPSAVPLPVVPSARPVIPEVLERHPVYVDPKQDSLTLFRLMLGIQTSPYLGFTISSPIGTRPAANIGLYARIVRSEQKAKDSFKVFSIVINGCYFLQIVIAAALTALGAARASSGAVTAFGALNTVIAGLLTFLKGSGLPGRLKYYGNEWKKIREFVEQRERDFMRPGSHDLDVYDVVDTIERMYNNLKADIELNTPDSYTSVTNQRRAGDDQDGKVGGIDISKIESLAQKLKGLESHQSREHERLAKKAEDKIEHLQRIEGDVTRSVRDQRARLSREADEQEARIRAAISEGKQTVKDGVEDRARRLDDAAKEQHDRVLAVTADTGRAAREGIDSTISHATGSMLNLVTEISEIHQLALTGGRASAAQQIRSLASRLDTHDDRDKEHTHEVDTRR